MFKEESVPMLLKPFQKAGGRDSSLNSCSGSRISNCGNLGENCIAEETATLVCPNPWPFDSESLPTKASGHSIPQRELLGLQEERLPLPSSAGTWGVTDNIAGDRARSCQNKELPVLPEKGSSLFSLDRGPGGDCSASPSRLFWVGGFTVLILFLLSYCRFGTPNIFRLQVTEHTNCCTRTMLGDEKHLFMFTLQDHEDGPFGTDGM